MARKELITRRKERGKEHKNKNKNKAPESENEILASGVDYEEAGEKWRAGDAAKSLRFFLRATATYATGLQRFPQSFDLAYNKARLEYEIAQQSRFQELVPTPLLDLLQEALDSHRTALNIKQDSPDLLFNTAQILTSIAEALTGSGKASEEERDSALGLLQEAFNLFQRCLNLQEIKYTQAQEDTVQQVVAPSANDGSPGSIGMSDAAFNASEEEIWASVEEPVTKATILDTVIAQLDTLTLLCSLDSSKASSIAWIQEYYHTTLQTQIKTYLNGTSGQHEAALAIARFVSAVSNAEYKAGRLGILSYEQELTAVFTHPELGLTTDVRSLWARADAELTFNASLQASLKTAQSDELPRAAKFCWTHITKALDSLSKASKVPETTNLPRIHLRRGDCEMLRLYLSEAPLSYDLAYKSMPTLLNNAALYYRTAGLVAKKNAEHREEQKDAQAKEAIATALANDKEKFAALITTERHLVQATVEDMYDDGLLGREALKKLMDLLS